MLLNPAYTWNPIVRKAYVLLWPVAIVLRSFCFVILVAIMLIAAWVCTAWVYFEGVWKGEDVRW